MPRPDADHRLPAPRSWARDRSGDPAGELPWTSTTLPRKPASGAELRTWLDEHIPPEWQRGEIQAELIDYGKRVEWLRGWQRTLYDGGWCGIAWPEEYGGRGASLMQQAIFLEEMGRAGAPELINVIGVNMVGPTIIAHGTEAQKQRYLEKILSAEEIWAQGYSEPNSGSDLASLASRCEVHDDHFVVSGQKVWTTLGMWGDQLLLLVRTNTEAPKHSGISCLLVDMKTTEGVSVRPLVQMTGEAEFGEVFLENAIVPRENLLGEIDGGWATAMTTLAHEAGDPLDGASRSVSTSRSRRSSTSRAGPRSAAAPPSRTPPSGTGSPGATGRSRSSDGTTSGR